MKMFLISLFAIVALTKAEIDRDNAFPLHIKEYPHGLIPHGIPGPRITGGVEAAPNSIPYQVGLFLPVEGGTAFCGGSLITPQTILTAAHCVDGLVGEPDVVLGAHHIRNPDESTQIILKADSVYIHSQWSSTTLRNDIALVYLAEPVPLNDNIQTIKLANDTSNTFEGHQARASGWGRDSDESNTISDVLREVSFPVISNAVCNVAYLGSITDTHICTSGLGGRSTCNGDSGGPLVVGGQQIGLVSFGIALGCEVGWPSVYTRITSFSEWIDRYSK